jgi:signal transduction histidine kinase
VLYASPPAAELFRTSIEQLLQQYAGDFFADSDEHKVLAGELVKTGRLENVEFLGRRSDATTFPAAGTAKRIIYNGKPCYINTLLDLSERKLAEELSRAKQAAEEANRMKSQFLAHMSHELRTPLNAVLGYSQILRRDGELSEKQRDGLNVIHTAGEHLLALINDLLDFPRSEARRLEVNNGVFNLKHFLQGVERIFRFKAEEIQLSFRQNLAADLPAMVSGDARKLRQIIFNLLGNAIKFTATGQIEFAVGQDSTDGQIRFSVTDTGAGIRQHDLERVFQPFQQAGEKETMPEGTGLGLTISRNMVELLGGKLHLESEYGRGSRFWFSIPVPASDAAPAEPAESGEEPAAPAAANPNTLIFPDEEELTLLRELARQGDIKTILERVRRLQQQDARYSPFAGELKALAKGFQIKKIAQFLTRR